NSGFDQAIVDRAQESSADGGDSQDITLDSSGGAFTPLEGRETGPDILTSGRQDASASDQVLAPSISALPNPLSASLPSWLAFAQHDPLAASGPISLARDTSPSPAPPAIGSNRFGPESLPQQVSQLRNVVAPST